jgi:inner membrane protein involved in colicin E2 resistance
MKNLLAQSALTKVLLLALLTLFAGLPLARIAGLIDERGASRQQAAHELATRHAGPQVLAGPMLVIPYVERWTEEQQGENGQVKARIARVRVCAVAQKSCDAETRLRDREPKQRRGLRRERIGRGAHSEDGTEAVVRSERR